MSRAIIRRDATKINAAKPPRIDSMSTPTMSSIAPAIQLSSDPAAFRYSPSSAMSLSNSSAKVPEGPGTPPPTDATSAPAILSMPFKIADDSALNCTQLVANIPMSPILTASQNAVRPSIALY